MIQISVLIPTYNRAPLLERCLNSVLSSPFADMEVLVADNASPDATPEALARFKDPRLRHWRNPTNIGPVLNMFRIAQQGRGKWLFFLTDDDYLLPGAIEKLVHLLQANPDAGVIMTPLRNIEEQGRVIGLYHFHSQAARFSPGLEALSHQVWAAHVLSRITIRREWTDLRETPILLESMYPQMYWVGMAVREHPGVYHDEPLVAHTVGNKIYWEYSDDFMVRPRIELFKAMLPGAQWKKERAFLIKQLIEQISVHHFPITWKKSFFSWVKHNGLLLRIPEVTGSSSYWKGLFGFLKLKAGIK